MSKKACSTGEEWDRENLGSDALLHALQYGFGLTYADGVIEIMASGLSSDMKDAACAELKKLFEEHVIWRG